ncbi:uncharacterized protein YcbK (DUF882 family) [Labrenzia sp. MBR-25]|jgi:uncharacterized protein YcbK (DUF882 family)|uniref:Peptidase M15A C-terminal domain-containing protein n=1 Tax=Roseibium aggregatum (strain ATCC 25650 / DSM 13394 / JCM 20685 / NBRC 16684 / NCIMB 2208 / IAM 12614 / B1) TaxID=384765 RepID=A0NXI9_ROSAI|nr:D-Ala-D-Ala carboxypeptidase family metallohydrolase [Roseibium aggregatum]EAV42516.1 hypothetical protein SIAM614_28152 [Stappia aggregata IAM 12614] [Roseibium aggregatum IAM 12614]
MRQRLIAWIVFLGLTATLAGCGTVAGVTGMGWMTASHNSIDYNDSSWCVPRKLKKVLNRVASRYGKVTVSSTKRWWLENWWKGGAKDSYHLNCRAVDFSVRGNPSSVIAFLKAQPEVGGYKHYSSGHYHIDIGPRRTW